MLPRNVDEYVDQKVRRYLNSLIQKQEKQTAKHKSTDSTKQTRGMWGKNRQKKRRKQKYAYTRPRKDDYVKESKRCQKKTQKQKYAYIRPVKDDYGEESSFEVMGCGKRGGLIRVSDHYGLALLRHTTEVCLTW